MLPSDFWKRMYFLKTNFYFALFGPLAAFLILSRSVLTFSSFVFLGLYQFFNE